MVCVSTFGEFLTLYFILGPLYTLVPPDPESDMDPRFDNPDLVVYLELKPDGISVKLKASSTLKPCRKVQPMMHEAFLELEAMIQRSG